MPLRQVAASSYSSGDGWASHIIHNGIVYRRASGVYLLRPQVRRDASAKAIEAVRRLDWLPKSARLLSSSDEVIRAIRRHELGGDRAVCCSPLPPELRPWYERPVRLHAPRGTLWVEFHAPPAEREALIPIRWIPVYVSRHGAFVLDDQRIFAAAPSQQDPTDGDERLAKVLAQRCALEIRPLLLAGDQHGKEWRTYEVRAMEGRRPRLIDFDEVELVLERRVDLLWVSMASPGADYELTNATTLDDPPWHLRHAGFFRAKDLALEFIEVDVDPALRCGLIDVNISTDHPYLGDFAHPMDAAGSESIANDFEIGSTFAGAHGTSCAGILCASPPLNLPQGVDEALSGVAPGHHINAYDALVWSLRSIKDVLSSVLVDSEVHVLSMSFAHYPDADMTLRDAADIEALLYRAHRRGIVLVAAAGNAQDPAERSPDPGFAIGFPARNPHVIAVGAIDANGRLIWGEWGSRFGRAINAGYRRGVSVVAPGRHIRTIDAVLGWTTHYTLRSDFSGTSAAAPQVAGLALLLTRKYDSLRGDPARVREIIEGTAEKLPGYKFAWESPDDPSTRNDQVGYGLISARDALDLADVAIVEVERSNEEDAQITLNVHVLNRGPDAAEDLTLWAWVVDRTGYWRIVRDGDNYVLFVDELKEMPQRTQLLESCPAHTVKPLEIKLAKTEGMTCILLVDTPKDHAFHKALLPFPPFKGDSTAQTYGIVANAPHLLRGYNNLHIVDLDRIKIMADVPESEG